MATDSTKTAVRVLRLLDLLQTRSQWTATELATKLEVSERCIRRDVTRLRHLGYPVNATTGQGGGYRLGRGRKLPPLLFDDAEVTAITVSLRVALVTGVANIGEAVAPALAKLDQFLPARLRELVDTLTTSTELLAARTSEPVDLPVLLETARSIKGFTLLAFSYRDRSGTESSRRVEPYRIVTTGIRWYLMAFCQERQDWRTFRLDRMSAVRHSTFRFSPRPAPDASAYLQKALSEFHWQITARVEIIATQAEVKATLPTGAGTVTAIGDDKSLWETGAESPVQLAHWLLRLPWEFRVLSPESVRSEVAALGARLLRSAGAGKSMGADTKWDSAAEQSDKIG